ncbi:MAG: hypothetical protein AB7V50_10600, partial [Vampirovibrionia bacterium]
NTNFTIFRSLYVGLITGGIIVLFYIVVLNVYNLIMCMSVSGYICTFSLDYNMFMPLLYCLLGSLIAGIYSNKFYKPHEGTLKGPEGQFS